MVLGQGVEQAVDRHAQALRLERRLHAQHATFDRERGVGRNHVHVIRLNRRLVLDLLHAHRGRFAEQIRKHRLMAGVEVLYEEEYHATVGRQVREKALERLEAPGGGADAHYRADGRANRFWRRLRCGLDQGRVRCRARSTPATRRQGKAL